MKKFPFFFLLILAGCWAGTACNHPPFPPLPPPAPSATPTPNLTPVCGMTPVTMPAGVFSLADSGIQVIKNAAQWDNFIQSSSQFSINATPVPTATPGPPVDFNTRMIITAGVPEPCDNSTLAITNVCEGPDVVTVYATWSTCTTCPMCNMASTYAMIGSAVAVPASSLPVTVVYTYTGYTGVPVP